MYETITSIENDLRISKSNATGRGGLDIRVRDLDVQLTQLRGDLRSHWKSAGREAWMSAIEEMQHRLNDLRFYIDCRECLIPGRRPVTNMLSNAQMQREMLIMAAHGMTSLEIGSKLGLTASGVNARFTVIYRQMGVRSRSQAIAQALASGWIMP
jgi:DNA-binding CsgD family transcriptional regulator